MQTSDHENHTIVDDILRSAHMHFQDKGFDNTTVKDILSGLRIDEERFYQVFQSKDEVLEMLWSGRKVC